MDQREDSISSTMMVSHCENQTGLESDRLKEFDAIQVPLKEFDAIQEFHSWENTCWLKISLQQIKENKRVEELVKQEQAPYCLSCCMGVAGVEGAGV